jgi:hypothetical protein
MVLVSIKDSKAPDPKVFEDVAKAMAQGVEFKSGGTPAHTKPTELEPT